MPISDELRESAEAWRSDDPDPSTVAEIDELLEAEDEEELADRFRMDLEFGTAGLRGLLGAGPNRMNRAVVLRTTAGLCTYLAETTPDALERGICVGYDGRRMSRAFADDVASVATGLGFKVRAFDSVSPTPLVGFACKDTHAAGAVVVTASHNPPDYNGYKVFWGNGAQIIPPHDEGIAAHIKRITSIESVARMSLGDAEDAGLYSLFGVDLERRYLDGVRSLQVHPGVPRDVSIAYTAMHGVGDRLARAALEQAGFTNVWSVPDQAEPDGTFPTVPFPNPEEAGAMDMVIALAKEKDAPLVFANDPDADRLAVAVRDVDGSYVQLSGNEVGCLLGHYLLDQGPVGDCRLVVNTIVSSPMLGAIARAHEASWIQTLTGFKWIANEALRLESIGDSRFVFGYEEALGYTIGPHVRDKDGIGTAVVVADLAAWCHDNDRTLLDELESAWRRYGMYLSRQVSQVYEGAEGAVTIRAKMQRVRQAVPQKLGRFKVEASSDLQSSEKRSSAGVEPLSLPKSNVLAFELEGGHRVMLRPSGTEPKLKSYFDVCVAIGEDEDVDSARARGEKILDELAKALADTLS